MLSPVLSVEVWERRGQPLQQPGLSRITQPPWQGGSSELQPGQPTVTSPCLAQLAPPTTEPAPSDLRWSQSLLTTSQGQGENPDGLKEEASTMLPLPWSNSGSYGWKLDLDRTYCYSTLHSRSPPILSLSNDTKAISKDVQERNAGFYFVAINTTLWYFNPITVWSVLTTTMNRWMPPRRRSVYYYLHPSLLS